MPRLRRLLRPRSFASAALLVPMAALLTACADSEPDQSARMMENAGQSGLGANASPQAPGRADAPGEPPATTGRYRWNGNPERVTAGSTAPEPRRPIAAPYAGQRSAAGVPADAQIVVVQPGDTLHRIAERHHVTVASLTQANRLSGAPLQPGQHLLLPPVAR